MFEGLFQPLHLIVIFAIVLLVFGPKELPEIGKGLGESIRGFKKAISTDEPEYKKEEPRQIEDKKTPSTDDESESKEKRTEEKRSLR